VNPNGIFIEYKSVGGNALFSPLTHLVDPVPEVHLKSLSILRFKKISVCDYVSRSLRLIESA